MRKPITCLLLACLLLTGCEWLSRNKPNHPANPPGDRAAAPPTAEQLVSYLNKQADRISVIESTDITLVAHVDKKRMPGLTGFMVCEKPRNFRLAGDALSTQYVDIGSNGEQFWFWVKDGDAPLYYCSYNDYERGVKLPLPFQPEWVVEALGMAKYDPNKPYSVKVNGGNYELVEETTVQGQPVRKITVFASQVADETYPRVTGHIIQDARTGRTICHATIRRVRWANYRTAEGEARVSFPSDVLLEWPDEKLSMTMKIDKATINQKITEEAGRRYFTLPNWPGIKAIDLARYQPSGSPTSRDVRQAGGYR